MNLPDQRPTAPVGQPTPAPGPFGPAHHDGPLVYVPDPTHPNLSIPVPRELVPMTTPTAPRDLTPQPLLDPTAQRMLAAGLGAGTAAAGIGWGAAQVISAAAAGATGLIVLALLLLAARLTTPRATHIEQHVTNHVRGLGRATTHIERTPR
ncbi:hypothetical protein [Streptomyces sp. DH12]|uniref:hypothetical protein n=1 Tax=Streptomyces sp. DH12 TaxID=2857010 RepID=UPI001E4852E3|nr:hypothetical protein [Streptomyces sp. DH12]